MSSNFERETQKSDLFLFTVFTPTYNRAHTLHRVYDSLKAQTYRDFEWLIVDDGSTDDTKPLVEQWQKEAYFPIRYIYQENAGKHVACNRGLREAKGELFLTFDSDDACVPEALERFKYHWDSIPQDQRDKFSAVTALCVDQDGTLLGNTFPFNVTDSNSIEIHTKYNSFGDKWGFQRTEVLKEFPFPEIPGEKFIAEGIVWNRLSTKYQTRYVNEKLQIKEYRKDGLSNFSIQARAGNSKGARLYYQEYLLLDVSLKNKLKNLINYIRFSLHSHVSTRGIVVDSKYRILTIMFLPVGYLIYKKDIHKFNK
jgi:glycosyltransferase involved in cell wall biosynthesis